jgi:uncharacterized protein YqjF (DUF2071 family)
VRETAHRPWPLPGGRWVQGQTWHDVLFAHWRVDPEALRPAVPAELPIDTFDGSAWLGVVPFRITGLGLRTLPARMSFLEANVRTYTTVGGRPGIYFLSLDAESALAVAGARLTYGLPYFHARMAARRDGARVVYSSRRGDASLDVSYGPAGEVFQAAPGTLEHFLVERYRLYTVDRRRRIRHADIHHSAWPLQPAKAQFARNTMSPLAEGTALLHYARRQDVVVWPLR